MYSPRFSAKSISVALPPLSEYDTFEANAFPRHQKVYSPAFGASNL